MATRIDGPSDEAMMGFRDERAEQVRRAACYPDLLAACQSAYTAIVNHHAAGERIAGSRCEVCKGELELLRAAIAKATGPQAR